MFTLLRYFSIASLVAFVIVVLVLVFFYRQITVGVLIELEGQKNVALAQAFANSIDPELDSIIAAHMDLEVDELRSSPEIEQLQRVFVEQAHGLPVVKIVVDSEPGIDRI